MLSKILVAVSISISLVIVILSLTINNKDQSLNGEAVREENGVQYITISARGGYSPSIVSAKAGIPTVIEVETNGTYDCSASLVIPKLGFQEFLPATGTTKIDVPAESAQGSLDLLCSMGMYGATIEFDS